MGPLGLCMGSDRVNALLPSAISYHLEVHHDLKGHQHRGRLGRWGKHCKGPGTRVLVSVNAPAGLGNRLCVGPFLRLPSPHHP
eukprot:5832395-Pyramimonas_sp.AAC.1